MASFDLPVFLAAHGERGGAGDNQRLQRLAADVSERLGGRTVVPVLVNDREGLNGALSAHAAAPGVVLPLLFSDGFFYAERLLVTVASTGHRLVEPMALWPDFADLLAGEALERLGGRTPERTVLVAHGSSTSGRSAACARLVAQRLTPRLPGVEAAFLEERPFATDVMSGMTEPWLAIGLFFGDGLHGREDFDAAIAGAAIPPLAAFTAGEMEGLAGMLARRAEAELAAMRGS